MDQFYKVRKKMSIAESTRQVLNKSIDLLHKLSNRKLAKEEMKQQLSTLLSNYFFAVHPDSAKLNFGEVDETSKIKLELFLEQAYEICDKVSNGKAPLYEAIMLMNKVVVAHQPNHEEVPAQPTPRLEVSEPLSRLEEEEDPGLVPDAFDLSGEVREKIKARMVTPEKQEVGSLIADVLKRQEELNLSISVLNHSLKEVGFELRPLSKERP